MDEREHKGTVADRHTPPWEYVVIALVAFCVILVSVAMAVAAVLIININEANDAAEGAARAAATANKAVAAIKAESKNRINETCTLFETDHLQDVKQLRATYRYLRTLPREDRGTTLTKAVIRGLPAQEREVRADPAPDYCDDPFVGLSEPDPELPKRRTFTYLLKRD